MNLLVDAVLVVLASILGTLWLATRLLVREPKSATPDPRLDAWRQENLRRANETYFRTS